MSERIRRPAREAFALFQPIQTRWMDNDAYGHVNNVVFYSYFDTAVNAALIRAGLLDVAGRPTICLVAETRCAFFDSVAFPERLEAGIAIAHLGRSSARYAIGVFAKGAPEASAIPKQRGNATKNTTKPAVKSRGMDEPAASWSDVRAIGKGPSGV